MTLASGARLGPYEVAGKIGEGGMGEVWRATDTRLRRQVALKVLPEAFTADAERLARFAREAQLLAQLQHPNVAAIFGIEEADGVRALVMELVEGPTLAERLATGPLPVDDAVALAVQLARALEEAHERGIIHRDLKPANLKITPDGRLKVLDFRARPRPRSLDGLEPGCPGRLADVHAVADAHRAGHPARFFGWTYAVAPDGERFLVREPLAEADASPLTVLTAWQRLLAPG